MVLKRTENILICIVIVYSAKILEFTGIKYFQKLHYKSPNIGRFVESYVCLNPFILKKSVKKNKNVTFISIISYVFNTLFKVEECERVSTSKLLDSKCFCLMFFPVLVMC